MGIFRIVVIFSLLVLGIDASAAANRLIQRYSSADGLPSNCIRDIIQDESGFIWLATDGGLSRFDGLTFKNFVPGEAEERFAKDPFVSTVAMCNHRLWIATIDGLLYYDDDYERLVCPELKYEQGCPRIDGFITKMGVDPSERLWIATASGKIYRLEQGDMSVRCYEVNSTNEPINTLFVDKRGDVWASGSYNAPGLYKYDAGKDKFEEITVGVSGKSVEIKTRALAEDSHNRIWIGLFDGILVCYNPFAQTYEIVSLCDKVAVRNIHSITPVGNDELYIGNDFGVVVYNIENGACSLLKRDELRPGSLSGEFVYPIVCDSEGGVWIGTFYAGLNYLQPDIKHFASARHSRFVNSVSGNIISSFCEDKYGNIYIGSEDGGVCRYDKEKDTYSKLYSAQDNAAFNVHSLCMDGEDLWVGTYSNGILVFDSRTGKLKRDMAGVKRSDGMPLTMGYTLMRDRQGDLWVASANDILLYDRKEDCFKLVKRLNAWTTDIKQDASGHLWFSTQGQGLYRYSRHNDEWKHYMHAADQPSSLIYDHVACVDFDDKGTMWVATGNGLARYRDESDDFERVGVEDANAALQFVKSSGEELWIGTGNGLVRFSPQSGESTHFSVVDGLVDNQFAISSVFKDSKGEIYAGTINGYTHFLPSQIGINKAVPSLVFTSLYVLGRQINVGDDRLPMSLNSIERLELGPDDNAFSIGFAALSYVNPENNTYLYKLEGFDKDWMTPASGNQVSYTNLEPGDYTLRVKASNNDKVWNEAGISLPIHIKPHWYSTWWSKTLYALLFLSAIFSIMQVMSRRNRRLHVEEIEKVKTAKELEVYQAKLNFFTTVAHEIRTPVSLIIGPLESIMKTRSEFSETQNEEFDIIHRNTQRLLFLVNQLLDFRKVESLSVDAKFLPTDISALVRSVAERFRPTLSHRGIKLDVELPSEPIKADVDAEALTKLVSNLLNNARKFTRRSVTLTCGIDHADETFFIEVADDGVGISEGDMTRIFQPFVQVGANERQEGGTGLGLSIVKHVVEAHSGKIEVKSHPGDGSRFIVTLPLRQEGVARLDDIIAEDQSVNADTAETEGQDYGKEEEKDKPVMLVVDDNLDLLRFLHNYFSNAYTVITAADAKEAIKSMARCNVDLIVSDWMMPGISGVEFCRTVRENRDFSHIPFIMLTAKTDESSKIEGLNCGADAYIEKPFSIDYLSARISNLLELRNLLKQKFSTMPLEPIETLAANPVDNDFLVQLTKLIEDNFSNPELSVDFICQGLGISRSGLYAKVRTLTDNTPNELIQITRLKRAAQLLSEHRYRVNEICYMVGFSNPSYFAKCFQKQFGMKPGEFNG